MTVHFIKPSIFVGQSDIHRQHWFQGVHGKFPCFIHYICKYFNLYMFLLGDYRSSYLFRGSVFYKNDTTSLSILEYSRSLFMRAIAKPNVRAEYKLSLLLIVIMSLYLSYSSWKLWYLHGLLPQLPEGKCIVVTAMQKVSVTSSKEFVIIGFSVVTCHQPHDLFQSSFYSDKRVLIFF